MHHYIFVMMHHDDACAVLVPTSSDRADNAPRVTVTSSNDAVESLMRTTSLPLRPDCAVTDGCDALRKSTPVSLDVAHNARNARRNRPGYDCGAEPCRRDKHTCQFDNRVYSPDGSTSSRCSEDDDDDDDETLMSHCEQLSPIVSTYNSSKRFVYSRTYTTVLCMKSHIGYSNFLSFYQEGRHIDKIDKK